jgi:glycosyltransferase involved in cell wall biosynthesis
MSEPRITGIINTKNESIYIAQAIKSLMVFVDEVVIADMASSDDTVQIARNLGARIVSVPDFGFVEPARQVALDAAKFEWIFVLDADEIVPPRLADEIRRIAAANEADVVSIPCLNFMIGKSIRHTGWGSGKDRHPRFFRRSSVMVSDKLHVPWYIVPEARFVSLPATDELSIHHFNYIDWSQFVSKMNRYTTIEANQLVADGKSKKFHKAFWFCFREFGVRFILRAGYRDGYEGLVLSCLMVTYRLLVAAKSQQLTQRGDDVAIQKQYMSWARAVADGSTTTPPF